MLLYFGSGLEKEAEPITGADIYACHVSCGAGDAPAIAAARFNVRQDLSMPSPTNQRHGCLTTLLIFMLAANSLGAASYLFSGQRFAAIMKTPEWVTYML